MSFPWARIRDLAVDVAVAVVGALLVNRVEPAASTPAEPTPPPKPRTPPPRFEDRADSDITARGHAGIDERFRTQPAPEANQPPPGTIAPVSPRSAPGASGPLPGSALRGEVSVDPDATEPEVPDAIARRGAP
ncbi:hypothetical protein [Sorangium sp. So ce388]|uniref:hypothetical protein n=1 Tax=Sorangium sp. So ce388 TaxID=3133309 RepID=UPI003F5B1A9C